MSNLQKILVVRTDRIGDVVLTLPLAGLIRKHFPNAEITFLLRRYTKALAENNPNIDKIITLEDDPRKLPFGKINNVFKYNKYDAAVFVSPHFKTAFSAFIQGVNIRIGTGYRWYSFLFNEKIFEHRKYGIKHELVHNVEMLNPLGISETVTPETVEFNIHPDEKKRRKIDELLKSENAERKPIVVIHPGSGGSSANLPIKKMKRLAERISDETDGMLMLTGSENERELCERIAENTPAVNLAGKLDLYDLIALIDCSDIFIGNSTGPLHIASALGKFVVGFYPNIPCCSPVRWGPFTRNKEVFLPESECNNLTLKQYIERNCMNSIDIGTVFETVRNKIERILK